MDKHGIIIEERFLGKKINDIRMIEYLDSTTPHILAYTGVVDFMGDEIILTILPDKGVISDEGYTEYALEGAYNSKQLSEVEILIRSHNVDIVDGYTQNLEIKLNNKEYTYSVNQLTSCIIDVYASLIYQAV